MFIPSEEERDLEEDENGTPRKGGKRASPNIQALGRMFRLLTRDGTFLQTTNITGLTN